MSTKPPARLSEPLQLLLNPLMQVVLAMMDGVLLCDAEGRILLVNQSVKTLFGLTDAAQGERFDEVIRDEELQALVHGVLLNGESVSEELLMNCQNRPYTFQAQVMPILTEAVAGGQKARVSGCVVVLHDITAIRRTEKMRRDFVANVSHELRTPLSAIKGYAETLIEGAIDDETVARDFVNVIHNHSIRLSRLVEDLLDLSKLESPDFQPELQPVLMQPVALRVLELVQGNTGGKTLTFMTDLPEDLPPVWANIGNLEQVLTNLLDNAVKYTSAGGRIAIQARLVHRPQGAMVRVDVSDTGIGIENKHISRLFERFYRVDKARSRDLGGTGLGLSIVKHIIQYHGGEIWVNSEPNEGSTFSFTLRVAEAAE